MDTQLINDSAIQLILTVKIHISPDDVESFFSHFQSAFDAVMKEPECRYFVVGEDVQNPGVITWTEGWTESVEWFMGVQLKKAYYEPYFKATEPLYIKPREITLSKPRAGFNGFKLPEVAKVKES